MEESYELLDINDSDLPSLAAPPLTNPLLPCKPSHFSTPLKPCSHSRPPPQSQTLVEIPKNSAPSPSTRSKSFTIPGPAGVVQSAMRRKGGNNDHNQIYNREDFSSTQEFLIRAMEVDEENDEDGDFKLNPWICGMDLVKKLGLNNIGDNSILGEIKNLRSGFLRVPQVVAIVTSCTPNGLGDLIVTLKDPSGTIGANIHRKVVREFGKDISVGSVLVLQEVALFSPSPSSHYLNITLENVIKVIRKDSGPPLSDRYPISSFRAAPSFAGTTNKPSSGRLSSAERNTNAPVDIDVGRYVNHNDPVNGERSSNLQSLFAGKFSRATNTISDPHTAMEVEPLVREVPSPRPTQTHVPLDAPRVLNTENQAEGAIPQSLNCRGNAVSRATIPDWTDEQLAELIDDDW
ncbi:hypothetical protein ACHQM5_030797 [Ranunculus cassubicifolius]